MTEINALAIMCVDSRLHRHSMTPQIETLLGVNNVFVRTLVGPEGRILGGRQSVHVQSLRLSMEDLIPLKIIRKVAIIGHSDCAGHNVSDEQHIDDCLDVVSILQNLFPDLEFIPMFASKGNDGHPWNVRLISEATLFPLESMAMTEPARSLQMAAQMNED